MNTELNVKMNTIFIEEINVPELVRSNPKMFKLEAIRDEWSVDVPEDHQHWYQLDDGDQYASFEDLSTINNKIAGFDYVADVGSIYYRIDAARDREAKGYAYHFKQRYQLIKEPVGEDGDEDFYEGDAVIYELEWFMAVGAEAGTFCDVAMITGPDRFDDCRAVNAFNRRTVNAIQPKLITEWHHTLLRSQFWNVVKIERVNPNGECGEEWESIVIFREDGLAMIDAQRIDRYGDLGSVLNGEEWEYDYELRPSPIFKFRDAKTLSRGELVMVGISLYFKTAEWSLNSLILAAVAAGCSVKTVQVQVFTDTNHYDLEHHNDVAITGGWPQQRIFPSVL